MFFFVFFENLNFYFKNEKNMPFSDTVDNGVDEKKDITLNETNVNDTFLNKLPEVIFLNKLPELIVNQLNNIFFSNLNIYVAFFGSIFIYSIYIGLFHIIAIYLIDLY